MLIKKKFLKIVLNVFQINFYVVKFFVNSSLLLLVDGDWTAWSQFSSCFYICGSSQSNRSRTCTNPSPQYGGKTCNGDASESQTCTGTCASKILVFLLHFLTVFKVFVNFQLKKRKIRYMYIQKVSNHYLLNVEKVCSFNKNLF